MGSACGRPESVGIERFTSDVSVDVVAYRVCPGGQCSQLFLCTAIHQTVLILELKRVKAVETRDRSARRRVDTRRLEAHVEKRAIEAT